MLSIYWRERNLRIHCGYYMGAIDSKEGKQLKTAYKNFQNDNGLKADGIYGGATDTKLVDVIKNLQNLLNKFGYKLTVDGFAGDSTENCLADFQSKHGLKVDKIAGQATYNALNGSTPQPQPTPSGYKCKYFKDSEFACPCCGKNITKDNIKMIADQIREHFGRPAIITSGTRCEKHNREVGGVSGSYHVKGSAIDIYVQGVSGATLQSYCQTIVGSGKARYTYYITGQASHIDCGNM